MKHAQVIAILKCCKNRRKYEESKANFEGAYLSNGLIKFRIGGPPTRGSFHSEIYLFLLKEY